jgi:hypothetical protein
MKKFLQVLSITSVFCALPAFALGYMGSESLYGEMPTNGSTGDNVSCACARKVASGDQSDQVCNQRVKEMVNSSIQRAQGPNILGGSGLNGTHGNGFNFPNSTPSIPNNLSTP